MNTITVDKAALIATMEENRKNHATIVAEAQAGFREAVIKRLDEMLAAAKQGKKINLAVGLRIPDDHTNEYDTVIGMLKLDLGEQVELDYPQYRQWVEDDWGWRDQFLTTNSHYSPSAASSLDV